MCVRVFDMLLECGLEEAPELCLRVGTHRSQHTKPACSNMTTEVEVGIFQMAEREHEHQSRPKT